ncbi:MAG: caspase family protein [Bacteroidota bacterium]
MNKIKVLSIGINHYAHERISNLHASVKDAQKMEHFFTTRLAVPAKHFCKLYNEAATREAIISNFRNHFNDLQSGDVAVFHFSGHGSTEPSSKAFIDAGLDNAGGKNEVLVCHDSRINGTLSIADKELRLLISEAQQDQAGNHIAGIHFVCLFDCCHSGSMLRQGIGSTRMRLDQGNRKERSLDQYLEGQYQRMTKLHIPSADFILIAACSPDESAVENDDGGYFTSALIELLEFSYKKQSYPSYAAFYSILRESIYQRTKHLQTPHLEYAGKVDPYDTFLQLQGKAAATYPAIVRHDDQWKVNLGAIHGIVFEDVQQQEIPICHVSDICKPIGNCRVGRVELEYTLLRDFKLERQQRFILADELNDKTLNQYYSELRVGLCGHKLPVEIRGTSNNPAVKELVKQLEVNRFILANDKAHYHLLLDGDTVTLEGPNNELLFGIQYYSHSCTNPLLHLLYQIGKWENIKTLTNTKSTRVNPDKMTLSFEYQNSLGETLTFSNKCVAQDERIVRIEFDPAYGGIPYRIKFSHLNVRRLHCYLVHLDRTFGMKQKYENYTKFIGMRDEIYLYDSMTDRTGLGIANPKLDEVEDTFILIAALHKLSVPYTVQQEGLGELYGKTIDGREVAGDERSGKRGDVPVRSLNEVEWAIRKITVRTVRKKS